MKYKVYQSYIQTDVQEVEAEDTEEAMKKCQDGDGWEDFNTTDYEMWVEEGELYKWLNVWYVNMESKYMMDYAKNV